MPSLRSVELVRDVGGGYGFTVSGQSPCFISWIADGSPAESSGLERFDCIIRVNGENVSHASHEHVVKLIGLSDVLQLDVEDRTGAKYSSSEEDDNDLQYQAFNELSSQRIYHKPPHRGQSRVQKQAVFSRTEHVLNELRNGTLFQALPSSLDSAPRDVNSSAVSSRSGRSSRTKPRQKRRSRDRSNKTGHVIAHPGSIPLHNKPKQTAHRRNLSLPIEGFYKDNYNANSNNVFVQSVVAYLGTVEIAIELPEDIPHVCFAAMGTCVHQLRREQHIHQRVLLKVTQNGVKLFSADGDTIAVYDRRHICFSSSCPEDSRFFCIATLNTDEEVRCHQFMIDPDISSHRNHVEKAKRFGIHCSMDTETGNCIEFPQSARIILKMIEALLDPQQMRLHNAGMNTIQGGGIHQIQNGDIMAASNPSTTQGEIGGLDGPTIHIQNHLHQSIGAKPSTKESAGSKLSQQNLKEHDRNTVGSKTQDGSLNRYIAGAGIPPTGMNAMISGKYKGGAGTLPLQRNSASSRNSTQESRTQEIRLSKRGKKGSKTGEGLFFRVPKRSSSRQLKLNMKNIMSKSSESIPLSETGQLSGASSIESLSSNASLPSYFNGVGSGIANIENGGRVSAWGISFDKMLEDTMGVKYFTEFLRKEFSQENILFWLECEKLRKIAPTDTTALKELADSIYERFLSGVATSPVNIDSKGQRLSEEALTKPPHPQMFEQQQNQIFKLMKLDSYSRFMKSSLYRQCLRCQVEGLPLPLEPEAQKDSSNETHIESRHSFSLKHRRLFPRRTKKAQGSSDSIHRDSSDSESGFIEALSNARPEDLATMHQVGVDAALICKLILWDGSSTVLYAEEGKASIREALNALCERRGVPLSAVDIYYQNEDRALALDQDVSVLAGQEVRVERRTLFRLDLLPMGRSVGVKAKPSKSTAEVLKPVVSKYGLDFDQLTTRLNGEKESVDLTQPVQVLDGLRVCVDYASEENSQNTFDKRSRKSKTKEIVTAKETAKENESKLPNQSDTEDLINLMSTAQSRKLHDQRGLLSEMNLELPDFLKTPSTTQAKLSEVSANNNNSNSKDRSIKPLDRTASDANGYHLDVPQVKGGKLSPNPVGTGNAKARIQKLKNVADTRPSLNVTPVKSKAFRRKTPSLDTDITNDEAFDADTLSAVDDDPFVITKWMQSVSCTPKYPYTPDLHSTFDSPGNTSMAHGVKDSTYDYDNESSVAHDHRYSKRNDVVHDN